MVVGDNRFFVHAALKPALDKFKALSVNGVVEYPGGVTLRRDERKSPHRFFIVSYVSATPPASGNGGEGSGAKGIRCDGGGGSSVHEQAQSHLADAEFVVRCPVLGTSSDLGRVVLYLPAEIARWLHGHLS